MLQDAINGDARNLCAACKLRLGAIAQVQAHCNGGNAQKCALNRCSNGAGINDIDADIGAGIHAAHHQVRARANSVPLLPQAPRCQFDAVRGSPLNGNAAHARIGLYFTHHQWMMKGDAVA